jgi:hypothetical protein
MAHSSVDGVKQFAHRRQPDQAGRTTGVCGGVGQLKRRDLTAGTIYHYTRDMSQEKRAIQAVPAPCPRPLNFVNNASVGLGTVKNHSDFGRDSFCGK